MEVSNNMLAALVFIAMAASITATMTIMSRFPVTSPITGMAQSQGAGLANVTLSPEANIKLLIQVVNFGTIAAGESNNTLNNDPPPFLLMNNGSTYINVSVAELDSAIFWDVRDNYCENCFQFNASGNGSTFYDSANGTGVWKDFSPAQNAEVSGFAGLYTDPPNLVFNFSNLADEQYMEVDIRIEVPGQEPSGYKEGTVLFKASTSS
jgi:hypothetical protein